MSPDSKDPKNKERPPLPAGDWDPRKTPGDLVLRRLKRRLKAAASIGLAIAAGTFLSFQRGARADGPIPAPNPMTPETQNDPSPVDTSTPEDPKKRKQHGKDKTRPDGKDKGKGQDKDKDKDKGKSDKDQGKVDKDEHRKGMPVPDNLLE